MRKLGTIGAIRFIQQYEYSHGDYSRDRKMKLPTKSMQIREIGAIIMKPRQSKAK